MSVISQGAGEPRETTWLSEKESDEYDILEALGKYLPGHDTVITFNGQSYDVPFLGKKFSAYGLSDPLAGMKPRDLFREYRPLKTVLGLPSGKLVDYDEYIRMHTEPGSGSSIENEWLPDISSGEDLSTADAVRTLRILGFDAVLELLHGSFDSVQAEALEDLVMFRIRTLRSMPCRISFHDGPFHLTASGRTAALSSRIEDGRIRFYHSDINNYIYLPHEGYAVYKTMAEFVDKSHRKKATRETCYTYAVPGSALLENPEQVAAYVKASLIYLGGRQ